MKKSMRISFIGDSLINGYGDAEYLGWAGRVCKKVCESGFDITFYNLGVRGETSSDIANRWEIECSRRFPEEMDCRIVFSFGINDTRFDNGRRRIDLKQSIKNANTIFNRAKDLYPVLVIGPPPVHDSDHNKRIHELSLELHKVCSDLHIDYLDIFSLLIRSDVWMHEVSILDGAHPSTAGYTIFSEIVLAWDYWKKWFVLNKKIEEDG